jgi:DNA-binding IclR family transcriptional regulator
MSPAELAEVKDVAADSLAVIREQAAPGTLLGSLTVAGPASRMTPEVMTPLLGPLRRACRDLSPRLAALLGPDPGATIGALDR